MIEPIYQQVFEPATGQCGIISYQAVDSFGVQLFSNMAAVISGTDFVFNISGNSATYTVQTIWFTFNILGDTTIVGTKTMALNIVRCSSEILQTNNAAARTFEYRNGDPSWVAEGNSWNMFTYPNAPVACIVDEYRVECTDRDGKQYIKLTMSDTEILNEAANLCTTFGLGTMSLSFDPVDFDPTEQFEGSYSMKIRGYKTGQEDHYAEIEWTTLIKIDCEDDVINVTNESSDVQIIIQPPTNSEFNGV